MSMNRSLGEGIITKITKKSAIIISERLGNVQFPIAAANVNSNDCKDLREKYSQDEELLFTAQKMGTETQNSKYTAQSVVKRRELFSCTGKITDCYEKFCYATCPKYGRVFIPYSSRIESGNVSKSWLGKGAEVNRNVMLKIFRQPDINNCRYVAWSLSLLDSGTVSCFPSNLPSMSSSSSSTALANGTTSSPLTRFPTSTAQMRGAEKQPSVAAKQLGIIVKYSPVAHVETLLYSAQTGLSRIPGSARESWMELGRFVQYDAVKIGNVAPDCKIHWCAKELKDLGLLFEVVADNMDETKLILNVKAVVNRVSSSTRSAWLWNDFIGRIYVPPAVFNRNLKVANCLEVRAIFTGAFEDVPWSALSMKPIDPEMSDEIREANSQLLLTDDNWIVKFIQTQQSTFFAFMDNPAYGSAFVAWTDLNDGDQPPPQLAKCRATVYYQQRDGKHAWRAVLVTQLDENGDPITYHPVYLHSGLRIMPEPFVAPQTPHQPPYISPPPGIPPIRNHWHSKTIQNDSQNEPKSPSIGVIGSGLLSHNGGGSGSTSSSTLPPSPPASADSPEPLGLASPTDRMMDEFDTTLTAQQHQHLNQSLSNIALDRFAPDLEFLPFSNQSLWESDFLKWKPQPDVTALSTSTTNSTAKSSNTSSRSVQRNINAFVEPFSASLEFPVFSDFIPKTRDNATQTDTLAEEGVLRDMMASKDIRTLLMKNFPEHFDRIMDLKWK